MGDPVRLIATAGQVADVTQAEALVSGFAVDQECTDKGYDNSGLVEAIGTEAVIPLRSNREEPRDHYEYLYKEQNLVEYLPSKIEYCRPIVATRYEKTICNNSAFWHSASINSSSLLIVNMI